MLGYPLYSRRYTFRQYRKIRLAMYLAYRRGVRVGWGDTLTETELFELAGLDGEDPHRFHA